LRLVRGILESASRSGGGPSDPSRRKAGAFFRATLDSRRRRELGIRPVEDDRQSIEAVRSVESLLELVARFHREGVPGLFSTEFDADERNSSVYALYIWQGGAALPDRDYYLLDRFAGLRKQYRLHIERIFRLAGAAPAEARRSAQTVLSIETRLARASRPRVDLRDPEKNYHRFTVRELARRYPRLAWKTYLRRLGVRTPPYIVVGQPEFLAALDRALGSIPLSDWKTYLTWHLLHDSAPHLDPRFEKEDFEFFRRRLLGQREPEPAWRRAATLVDGLLGEALGRLYVRRYFPPEARARMLDLVEDIRAVFRARLARVPWMTARTRARAVAKFDRFVVKIGHPTRYRNYGRLRISPRDHFGNVRRARAFEVDRRVARIGRKVDRDEWRMTPPTVNAHFVPTQNEIFFPAGILQPPFFDPTMDDPVNLGGIGVVIGHEITHGYDDQGRKFDENGNLRDWWTPADAREFRRRAQRIVDQYSRFEPLPGVRLNGALTAGENIADLGGVSLAHESLLRRLAGGRTPRRTIDGFTPEQRFFLSYGQIWRGNVRDEEQRRRVSVDPHSPGQFRVNGALANLEEFWRAFDVPAGSPMRQNPRRRVAIW
jgi:putative endopeptidase